MKYGILGTGAIGGLIAGHLLENGEDVCCYDVNQKLVETIQTEG